MLKKEIKDLILEKLAEHVNLFKVILFGSFAYGKPCKDSDIDLLVVTDDDVMPATYDENMKNFLKISAALRDVKKNIPIDLIVHSRPMHEKFIQMGSMFSKQIIQKGEVLYEKNH